MYVLLIKNNKERKSKFNLEKIPINGKIIIKLKKLKVKSKYLLYNYL